MAMISASWIMISAPLPMITSSAAMRMKDAAEAAMPSTVAVTFALCRLSAFIMASAS